MPNTIKMFSNTKKLENSFKFNNKYAPSIFNNSEIINLIYLKTGDFHQYTVGLTVTEKYYFNCYST